MGHEHIETALAVGSPQSRKHLDGQRPPPHLSLRVLVGTGSVAHGTAEAGDTQPGRVLNPAVNVDAALRSPCGSFESQGRPRIVETRRDRVVVARHVQQRHVEAGQVPARQHEVGLQRDELVSEKALVLLVRDGENAGQASTSRRDVKCLISDSRTASKPSTSPLFKMEATCDAEWSLGM